MFRRQAAQPGKMLPARNDPCPCGSGKKYKHCCAGRAGPAAAVQHPHERVAPLPSISAIERVRTLRDAGRFVEAARLAQDNARLSPADPAVHSELGLVHLYAARPIEAAANFKRAVQLAPRDAAHRYNLAAALELLGQDGEAITGLRQALALAPDFADAWQRLGNLLLTYGQRAEAVNCFRRAAELTPDTLLGRMSRARVLLEEQHVTEAEALLRETIAASPDSAEAKRFLARLMREQGRFDEAIPLLEEATESTPVQAATAYFDLALSRRVTADDGPMLEQMRALLALSTMPEVYSARLHYGLGKALDDLADYEGAMRHFDEGNRIVHSGQPFDRAPFALGVQRMITCFTPEFHAAHRALGSASELPVLVLGMPRSGTTLLEQIISSHPEVGAGGELLFWNDQSEAFSRMGDNALAVPYVDRVAAEYNAVLRAIAPDAKRVTDKMPGNFLWIGLIHLVFPRARIIHCRRHPVDTCLSNYFTSFGEAMPFANSKTDLVFYYRHYDRLMRHWRSVLPADCLLEVDYEELVSDRERVTRRLIDFIGLDWSDACLRPEDNQRVVKTASMWQARQPTYTTSVERWRRYEPWLGELRQLLEPEARSEEFRRSPKALDLIQRAAGHRTEGRLSEATPLLLEAAQLSPNDPWIENEAGLVQLARHAWPAAGECFERSIALDPAFAFAHYNLGFALECQRQATAAIAAYGRAIECAPKLAVAHSRLGNLLHAQGRREEALLCFHAAAAAVPDTTLGRLNEAKLLLEDEKPDTAETLLRQIIQADPSSSEAWRLLGNSQRENGRFDEATESLRQAIDRNPAQVAAYHDLAHAKRVTASDRPLIGRMQSRLRGTDINDFERTLLHFALGKSFDDLGEWQQAITHFDAGNRLEHSGMTFDRAGFAAGIDRLIARFTSELLVEYTAIGDRFELPVLILGMPRSGTTLVEQIISSHPMVGAGGELRFWNERATGVIDGQMTIHGLAADYLALLRRIAPGALRVTDKMPFNFLWAGLIHAALPNARIIHCQRDPIDTCLSMYFTRFATRQDFAYDRGDLAFYYRQYERLMTHWRRVLPLDRLLEIDYDALTANPEEHTRRLVAFCGLEWDDACLAPERNQRVVRTASMWQARQPVYRNSVARWRNYEPWLGELATLRQGA
jgi:tetratricopeptide (TPR) repeat protein